MAVNSRLSSESLCEALTSILANLPAAHTQRPFSVVYCLGADAIRLIIKSMVA